jgi:hypothetical protein
MSYSNSETKKEFYKRYYQEHKEAFKEYREKTDTWYERTK